MKILSPDGQLCVEADLDRQTGRTACRFRVLLGRHVLISRTRIDAPSALIGEAECRELVGRGGVVLARELTMRYEGGRCILRVSDDSFAAFSVGRGIQVLPRLSNALSCGYTQIVGQNGRAGCKTLAPAACRKSLQSLQTLQALLFFSNGRCATVVANRHAGAFIMTAAERPVAAVIPRGLRHLMRGLPLSVARRIAEMADVPGQDGGLGNFDYRHSDFSVEAFFLNFGYIFDAMGAMWPRAAQRGGAPHLPLRPEIAPNGVTPAHVEAFAMLADPSQGEAAASFRGEMGE